MRQDHPIRAILAVRGSSVRWLAGRLGIHETQLNHYLNARRTPPADFYDKVAAVLQVPVDFLRPAEPDAREAQAA